jgi:hypothetical protein
VPVSPAIDAVATIEPPPRRRSAGQRGVHAEDHAVEVDAHRPPVGEQVEVLVDAAAGRDAGVEEHQVEPAVHLLGRLGRGHDLVVVRDVAAQEGAADLLGDPGGPPSSSTSTSTTWSPRRASWRETSAPKPEAPPVTSATLPPWVLISARRRDAGALRRPACRPGVTGVDGRRSARRR